MIRLGAVLAAVLLLGACREEKAPRIAEGRLVRREGGSARSLIALV